MKEIGGFYWPDGDTVTPAVVLREVERLPLYLKHVEPDRRRVCVQAGGNVGVYARMLREKFGEVFTFEPDPENHRCLRLNNKDTKRLYYPSYGALGNISGRVSTWRSKREANNYGATQVRPSAATDSAPIIILDDFLKGCRQMVDFIMLDVEGWEQPALEGAAKIIEVARPTIALELKGLGAPHGWPDYYTRDWLHQRGYRKVERIGNDDIFVWTPSFAS